MSRLVGSSIQGWSQKGQGCCQRITRHRKERAQHTHAAAVGLDCQANRRHGGKPVDAATADESLQHRLGLILLLVAEQQVKDVSLPAPADKQRESCGPRLLLNPGDRAGARPAQSSVGDGAGGEPAPHLGGFGSRFRAQTVVDGEPEDRAAPRARPAIGEQAQCKAVRAAGDRHGNARRGFERAKRRHERLEGVRVDRRRAGIGGRG